MRASGILVLITHTMKSLIAIAAEYDLQSMRDRGSTCTRLFLFWLDTVAETACGEKRLVS
jgi:hypothetical protein